MASGISKSRVALAAICAAWVAQAPPDGARAQMRPAGQSRPPGKDTLAPLRDGAGLRGSDAALGAAPLERGLLPEPAQLAPTAANYGAPKKPVKLPKPYPPRRAPYPPPFSPPNPLPALEPYRSSYTARQAGRLRAMNQPPGQQLPPPPTVAVAPGVKVKPKPRVEANPFDPLGVPVGSTLLFPFVQTSGGYDDNPNRLSPSYQPRGSFFVRGEGGLKIKSDWDRHDLQGELRGGYSEYFDYPAASRPDAQGQMIARYDVTRDTALDLTGRLQLDTQRPGAPAISPGQSTVFVTNRPVIFGVGTQAGATQKFSRLSLSLRGTFDRVTHASDCFTKFQRDL